MSCADKIKTDLIAFKALQKSLVNSNKMIRDDDGALLASLTYELSVESTKDDAAHWLPRAQQIEFLANGFSKYIDTLQLLLKKEAGLEMKNGGEFFKESDKNAVMRVFIKQDKGGELYGRLQSYKQHLMAVDPEVSAELGKTILSSDISFDSGPYQSKDFTRTFFEDLPVIAALAMLTKFDNDFRVIANQAINFCLRQTAAVKMHGMPPVPIATVSKTFASAGEEVEIRAGLAYISSSPNPTVKVAGSVVGIGSDGLAHYTFATYKQPGVHHVPVEISFEDLDGQRKVIEKQVEFVVDYPAH